MENVEIIGYVRLKPDESREYVQRANSPILREKSAIFDPQPAQSSAQRAEAATKKTPHIFGIHQLPEVIEPEAELLHGGIKKALSTYR